MGLTYKNEIPAHTLNTEMQYLISYYSILTDQTKTLIITSW